MVSPADSLIAASGGDWLLTLASFLIILMSGIFVYLVRWITSEVPKQWQLAADKIVIKLCDVMKGQNDIRGQLADHDEQAEHIGKDVAEIKTTLQNRPCILRGR